MTKAEPTEEKKLTNPMIASSIKIYRARSWRLI